MYRLCSDITIAGIQFKGVNSVLVKRSIHTPCATAVIRVPVTAVLKQKDETQTAIETAKAVKVGDTISIRLGYNDMMNDEFKGYVKQLNYKSPLEIECEDEYFQTRQKLVTLSGTMTLKECLQKCNLNVLHAVNLRLRNFIVDNKPVSWVLEKLKTDYGLSVFFDMSGRIIAGRSFDTVSSEVKYKLRYNTTKDDDLKYQLATDTKMKVKAICFKNNGEKVEAETGTDGGAVKTLHFYDVEDMAELKTLAENELKKYSRDGYQGKIETFLQPYAEPCMIASLTDETYGERDGRYYIESVETSYGTSGARRNVSLGIKM